MDVSSVEKRDTGPANVLTHGSHQPSWSHFKISAHADVDQEPVDEAPEDEDVVMDAYVPSPRAMTHKAAYMETARGEGVAAPSSHKPLYGREACSQATPPPRPS